MKPFELEVRAKNGDRPYRSRRERRCADRSLIFGGEGWNIADAIGTDDRHRPPQKALVRQRRVRRDVSSRQRSPVSHASARTRRLRQVCLRGDIRRAERVGSQGDEQLVEVGSNVRRVWFRNHTHSGPTHHSRNHEVPRRTTEAVRTVHASWLGYGTRNRDVCHGF
jgi:hypothetical protein